MGFAKTKLNVRFAYALELRPKRRESYGFIIPPPDIKPTAEETWAGLYVVAKEITKISTMES